MNRQANIYFPHPARIQKIIQETPDVKSFVLMFREQMVQQSWSHKPGQFVEVSLLGIGEAPISISSPPSRPETLILSIKNVGYVTNRIHQLKEGDELGIRGPYGNGFPHLDVKGRDLLFVAGGIGLCPLRSFINYVFDNRKDYGKVTIVYGARTPADMVYKDEVPYWATLPDTKIVTIVDRADEKWTGNVGLMTAPLPQLKLDSPNTTAFVCGPPVAVPFVIQELLKMGLAENDIISTLENYMKCGVGKCGHCELGGKYMCTEGPVFRYNEMKDLGFG